MGGRTVCCAIYCISLLHHSYSHLCWIKNFNSLWMETKLSLRQWICTGVSGGGVLCACSEGRLIPASQSSDEEVCRRKWNPELFVRLLLFEFFSPRSDTAALMLLMHCIVQNTVWPHPPVMVGGAAWLDILLLPHLNRLWIIYFHFTVFWILGCIKEGHKTLPAQFFLFLCKRLNKTQ